MSAEQVGPEELRLELLCTTQGLEVLTVSCKNKWGGLSTLLVSKNCAQRYLAEKKVLRLFLYLNISSKYSAFNIFLVLLECSPCAGSCCGKRINGFFSFSMEE